MARGALQLVREAIEGWRRLADVIDVEVRREWLGNTSEYGVLARIAVDDDAEPIFIQFTIVDPWERMEEFDEDLSQDIFNLLAPAMYEVRFGQKPPARWEDEVGD